MQALALPTMLTTVTYVIYINTAASYILEQTLLHTFDALTNFS